MGDQKTNDWLTTEKRRAPMTTKPTRPPISFIPMSTDAKKIRFFGTLMPALLLLRASPLRFLQYQIAKFLTPQGDLASLIKHRADDAARIGDTLIFVHRWQSLTFDPFTFARAKVFLAQAGRLVRRAGYAATLLDPLSPDVNLPKLAASAGLGNLSPYGLLVHPIFGPRVILTGLQTAYPLVVRPHWGGDGCNDCLACVTLCPQKPFESGVIHLRDCQGCAKCLVVCPTGKGRRERSIQAALAGGAD